MLWVLGYFGIGFGLFKLWTAVYKPQHGQYEDWDNYNRTHWHSQSFIAPHYMRQHVSVLLTFWCLLLTWPIMLIIRCGSESCVLVNWTAKRVSGCVLPKLPPAPEPVDDEAKKEVEELLQED